MVPAPLVGDMERVVRRIPLLQNRLFSIQIPEDPIFLEPAHVPDFPDGWFQEMLLGAQHLVVGQLGEQRELHLAGLPEVLDQVVSDRSGLCLHGARYSTKKNESGPPSTPAAKVRCGTEAGDPRDPYSSGGRRRWPHDPDLWHDLASQHDHSQKAPHHDLCCTAPGFPEAPFLDRRVRVTALQDAIARYWGYTTFLPLQREAMDAVLAGRDSLVVLSTGGGKSLCFQAPAVVRPGLALIVSPLISLMKDQVDTLVGNGVPAALYNSSLAADEKAAVVAGLRQGHYRLLYVSPERLVGEGSDGFLALVSSCRVSFVAIDEAHCISQWGHDFRPEYRQLGRLRQLLPGASVHAYTATATARVRRDIAAGLALNDPLEFIGSFDRPNLLYRVLPRSGLKRQLLEVLDRHRREPGIIYCTSRREVDALAGWLTGLGTPALPYHAGLLGRRTPP